MYDYRDIISCSCSILLRYMYDYVISNQLFNVLASYMFQSQLDRQK